MDIALVVANLATSVVFLHSLLTARNYFAVRRDAENSEKKTNSADASGNMWGVEGETLT